MPKEAESIQANHRGRGCEERSKNQRPRALVNGTKAMSRMWNGVGIGSRRSSAEGCSAHSKRSVPKGKRTPRKARRINHSQLFLDRPLSGGDGSWAWLGGVERPGMAGFSSRLGSTWARMRRTSDSVTTDKFREDASRSIWSRKSATTSSASAPSAAKRARCWSRWRWRTARALGVQVFMSGLRLVGCCAEGFRGTRSWSSGCEVLRGSGSSTCGRGRWTILPGGC